MQCFLSILRNIISFYWQIFRTDRDLRVVLLNLGQFYPQETFGNVSSHFCLSELGNALTSAEGISLPSHARFQNLIGRVGVGRGLPALVGQGPVQRYIMQRARQCFLMKYCTTSYLTFKCPTDCTGDKCLYDYLSLEPNSILHTKNFFTWFKNAYVWKWNYYINQEKTVSILLDLELCHELLIILEKSHHQQRWQLWYNTLPLSLGDMSKAPSRCLKAWILPNAIYTVFFPSYNQDSY